MLRKLYHSQAILYTLHGILFVLTASALWHVEIPALTDYPNHLARAYIIHHAGHDTAMDAMYGLEWHISPYMLTDGLLEGLQYVTDIYTAGRGCILVAMGLVVVGVLSLQKILCQRISISTLLVYPLLYNLPLLWGFMSFTMGAGVMLLSLALWLRWRANLTPIRLLGMAVVITLNFLTHAISWAMLGLVMGLLPLYKHGFRPRTWQEWRQLFCLFLPSALCWLATPKAVADRGTFFGSGKELVESFLSPFYFTGSMAELLLPAVTICLLGTGHWAKTAQPMGRMLIIVSIVALLIPPQLLGILHTHIRLPWLIMLLWIASTPTIWPAARQHQMLLAAACIGAITLGGIKHWHVNHQLRYCGCIMQQAKQLMQHLPESAQGEPIMMVTGDASQPCGLYSVFNHTAALGMIEKRLFANNLFTVIPPVTFAPAYKGFKFEIGAIPVRVVKTLLAGHQAPQADDYRYLLYLHQPDKKDLQLPVQYTPIDATDALILYKNMNYNGFPHEAQP